MVWRRAHWSGDHDGQSAAAGADYEYYLDYTRAKVAIVHASLLETFAQASTNARYLRSVFVVGDKELETTGGHEGHPWLLNLEGAPDPRKNQMGCIQRNRKRRGERMHTRRHAS